MNVEYWDIREDESIDRDVIFECVDIPQLLKWRNDLTIQEKECSISVSVVDDELGKHLKRKLAFTKIAIFWITHRLAQLDYKEEKLVGQVNALNKGIREMQGRIDSLVNINEALIAGMKAIAGDGAVANALKG